MMFSFSLLLLTGGTPPCAPRPASLHTAGALVGLRDATVRHVAVAFHGQFMRGRAPVKSVRDILPTEWARAEGGVWPVQFDAFVASSTQALEASPCKPLDGAALCAALVARGQFRFARCELEPYNGTAFIWQAHALGLPWRDAQQYSLYPHRTLSDFATIGRALRAVKAHEAATNATYDLIACTRIDVLFYCLKARPVAGPPGSWFAAVERARVVGRRKSFQPMWEDRFVIGRRAEMASLVDLERNFARVFFELGAMCYPEVQLLVHFSQRLGLTGRAAIARTAPFEHFGQVFGFKQNKKKFGRFFVAPPDNLPGVPAKWRRANASRGLRDGGGARPSGRGDS